MKRKITYFGYLLMLISVVTVSCQKFLDDTPKSSLTTGNAYNSASDIENALAGCYNIFYTDYYQWENVMLSDNRADNAYPGGSGEETFVVIDQFTVPPSNSHNFGFWWGQPYMGIGRCNVLLDKVNSVTDPKLDIDNRRTEIIGEACFLRAFHYYQLVKMYGGVPLELESNTADPAVTRKARASEKEVYDQIVKDLQVALENLPDDYGDPSITKIRASKGAANALLAKIWAQRSDRDYSKVLTYCDAVINSPAGYGLTSTYGEMFDGINYLNSEAILLVPYIEGNWSVSNWGVQLYLAPEDGWQKYCVPSKDLIKAYTDEGDKERLAANVIFYKELLWGDENWSPCGNATDSVPFNYKQKHPAGWASGDNSYLLRFADILLLKAEAQNELGNTADAAATVNAVRARVGLADISSALSKAEMKAKILHERRLELAFEAQRWDDLVRTGEATNVMTALNEYKYTCVDGAPSAPVKINYNCDQDHWLMPIPQPEIDANPSLQQNPGY